MSNRQIPGSAHHGERTNDPRAELVDPRVAELSRVRAIHTARAQGRTDRRLGCRRHSSLPPPLSPFSWCSPAVMQQLRTVAAARPVASFFVLAYAISWLAWSLPILSADDALGTVGFVVGGFGPAVAAAVVTRLAGDSLRAWARPIVRWRVSARWYLTAFAVPVVVVAAASVGLVLLGAPVEFSVLPGRLTAVLTGYVFVALVGGGNEEPGWRGFALPRLQERHAPVPATLLLGVVWAFWHLPLLATDPGALTGLTSLADLGPTVVLPVLNIVGFAFLLTWIYNATGSVLLALLMHAGFNTANSTLVPLPFEALLGGSSTAVLVTVTVAVWVVALLLVVATRGRLGFDGRGAPP